MTWYDLKEHPVQLAVTACRAVHAEKKPYTMYMVNVKWDDEKEWSIERRFSDFYDMHQALSKAIADVPALPSRKLFNSMSTEVVTERETKLHEYLEQLLKTDGARSLPEFLEFVDAPTHGISVMSCGLPYCVSVLKDEMPCNDLVLDDDDYLAISAVGNSTVMSKIDSKLGGLKFWSKSSKQQALVDGGITIWRAQDNKQSWVSSASKTFETTARCVAWWTEKRTMFVGLQSGAIEVFGLSNDATVLEPRCVITHHEDAVYEVVIDKAANLLFSVAKDGTLAMFDVSREDPILKAGLSDIQANCIELDAANRRLFVGTLTGSVIIYKIGSSLEEIHRVEQHKEKVRRLYFHAPSNNLFSVCARRECYIWNVGIPGKEYSRTRVVGALRGGPAASVRSITFCPSIRCILTGHSNGVVCLWDTKTGKPSFLMNAHKSRVMNVTWVDDERSFWTAATDREIKLWRLPEEPRIDVDRVEKHTEVPIPLVHSKTYGSQREI